MNCGFASSQKSVKIIHIEVVILLVVQSKLTSDWLQNRLPEAVAEEKSHSHYSLEVSTTGVAKYAVL